VLGVRSCQPNGLVRLLSAPVRISVSAETISNSEAGAAWVSGDARDWSSKLPAPAFEAKPEGRRIPAQNAADPELDSLLYLIACELNWRCGSDTGSAWEMLAAARSDHEGTRAHALSLLEHSQRIDEDASKRISNHYEQRRRWITEAGMRTPYGLEIIESCMGCKVNREDFFCRFPTPVTRTVDVVSHHTVMPAGAVLFVEGQTPRGAFVVCSGKVKLSTTSKEGKVLILKQAEAGEVVGLSAAISGTNYEMTAETATPCQLNFIGRADLMTLLQNESEVGLHAAVWLSREFQAAYRDIHDLVLARSSSGKLARLLLSCALEADDSQEQHLRSAMTHEEMAQRIGSSRETVTRLLSDLKKKRLIRLEGAALIIRDRNGLEALAV
jgi:CRP/FNR family transcriptional regulator, cyclic AMP receptor protein